MDTSQHTIMFVGNNAENQTDSFLQRHCSDGRKTRGNTATGTAAGRGSSAEGIVPLPALLGSPPHSWALDISFLPNFLFGVFVNFPRAEPQFCSLQHDPVTLTGLLRTPRGCFSSKLITGYTFEHLLSRPRCSADGGRRAQSTERPARAGRSLCPLLTADTPRRRALPASPRSGGPRRTWAGSSGSAWWARCCGAGTRRRPRCCSRAAPGPPSAAAAPP